MFTLLQKCLRYIGSKRSGANAAEVKILIIIVYYMLLSLYAVTISIVTFFEEDYFKAEVKQYYLCEANGATAAKSCTKAQLDRYDGVSKAFAHVLVGAYPVIFLIYIMKLKTCITRVKSTATRVSTHSFSQTT